jgi:hypothetical protein
MGRFDSRHPLCRGAASGNPCSGSSAITARAVSCRRPWRSWCYLRSREHGIVIVLFPHVQVVIVSLLLCSQAVSIRSATGCQ